MTYTWMAAESKTGLVILDLPDVKVDRVSRTLMKYDSAQGELPLPTAPENWQRAIKGKAANLILIDEDKQVPVWGGMVLEDTRSSGDVIQFSLATIEAYFADRYVGDVTYMQVGQNFIVKDLVERFAVQGPNGGIPIRVVVNDGPGRLRDRTYKDISDKTLYSVLRELSGVIDGPEWTVEWEWLHDPERIVPVLYVGSRVGSPVMDGFAPAAVFDMPGSVTAAEQTTSYKTGSGANYVIATSTADGDTRPQSDPVVTSDPDRPTIEYRFSPSSSIVNVETLNSHAQARAFELADGSQVMSLSAVVSDAPRLGVDWSIGDDIGYVVGGVAYGDEGTPYESVPAFPGGLSKVARAIGWSLDLGDLEVVTPVLQNGEELGDSNASG